LGADGIDALVLNVLAVLFHQFKDKKEPT
jgi:hypothetical protein